MIRNRTDVLIVGAGPVGILTGLALAKHGVNVEIVDKEEQTAAHSHACVLHPRTLAILEELGVTDEVLALGRKIDRVGFYQGQMRWGELTLSELPGEFPFVVVLPQNDLEDLLERRAAQHRHAGLHWLHRLVDLQQHGGRVVAIVDKLCETSKGYPVATWQYAVEKKISIDASFVVGADGRDSHVRQLMNIEHDIVAAPEYFAVFEFKSNAKFADEIRVVLDNGTTNLFCPLPGNRGRWTFQIAPEVVPDEARLKDRLHARLLDPTSDEEVLRQMHRLIGRRAPWFDANAVELDWFTVIDFQRRLAKQYGFQQCWLAGDAAHSTSPLGMQSMNVGLSEGVELAQAITAILRRDAPLDLLAEYGIESRNEWRQLLGVEGAITTTNRATPWAREHGSRILACVPASGRDLGQLLSQLGLAFQPFAHAGTIPP